MNSKLMMTTAVAALLAVVGIFVYSRQSGASAGGPVAATGDISYEGQPRLGEVEAPVVLALFEDFRCPACRYFSLEILPELERDYIETGRAQLYFFNYPILGPESRTAALAAECAYEQNEAAFWDYKTILFRAQGGESQAWATPSRLEELADNLGELDAGALRQCTDDAARAGAVDDDSRIGRAAGVSGTPSLFIDGEAVENANDYGAVKALIDAKLGSASN